MEFDKRLWRVQHGRRVERTIFVAEQHTKLGLANARGVGQNGLKYRLKLTG